MYLSVISCVSTDNRTDSLKLRLMLNLCDLRAFNKRKPAIKCVCILKVHFMCAWCGGQVTILMHEALMEGFNTYFLLHVLFHLITWCFKQ